MQIHHRFAGRSALTAAFLLTCAFDGSAYAADQSAAATPANRPVKPASEEIVLHPELPFLTASNASNQAPYPAVGTMQPMANFNPALSPHTSSSQRLDTNAGWFHWRYMFGDLMGLRPWLKMHGVTLGGHYYEESAGNPVGGKQKDAKYTQQLDIAVTVDTAKAFGWPNGGQLEFYVLNRSGSSLSARAIGNTMAVQQLYGTGLTNRLAEFDYLQNFDKGKYQLRVGFAPLGNDFASESYNCRFQSLGFCGHLMAMSGSSGWRNMPTGQWGIRLLRRFGKPFYLEAGVYQSDVYDNGHDNGFKLTMTGTGVVVPVEIGWQPRGALPGNYKIGGYYDTSKAKDVYYDSRGNPAALTGNAFRVDKGREGVYALFDQHLVNLDHGGARYLAVFGGLAHADERTSPYSFTATFGGIWQGPFAARSADWIGLAWAYMGYNNKKAEYQAEYYARRHLSDKPAVDEQVVELDYGAQIAPWMIIRPNLQYVINPGGTGQIRNAFVLGLEGRLDF